MTRIFRLLLVFGVFWGGSGFGAQCFKLFPDTVFNPAKPDMVVLTGFEVIHEKAEQSGAVVARLYKNNPRAARLWQSFGANLRDPSQSQITTQRFVDFVINQMAHLLRAGLNKDDILKPGILLADARGQLHLFPVNVGVDFDRNNFHIPQNQYIPIERQIWFHSQGLQVLSSGDDYGMHDISHFIGLTEDPEAMREVVRLSKLMIRSSFFSLLQSDPEHPEIKEFKRRYIWATEWSFGMDKGSFEEWRTQQRIPPKLRRSRDLYNHFLQASVSDPEYILRIAHSYLKLMRERSRRVGGGGADFYNPRSFMRQMRGVAKNGMELPLASSIEHISDFENRLESGQKLSIFHKQSLAAFLAHALVWTECYSLYPPGEWLRYSFESVTNSPSPLKAYLEFHPELFTDPFRLLD